MKIDPILLSVYARTFRSITDEMSISMQKTTSSPILCEAKDFVTGLYDAEGRMLEQTENLPILVIVFNNGGWESVRRANRSMYPDLSNSSRNRVSTNSLGSAVFSPPISMGAENRGERYAWMP